VQLAASSNGGTALTIDAVALQCASSSAGCPGTGVYSTNEYRSMAERVP
jgi:hypothetical protein